MFPGMVRTGLYYYSLTNLHHALVSEGRSFKPTEILVLSGCHNTEGTHGTVINGIDELAVSSDFTD